MSVNWGERRPAGLGGPRPVGATHTQPAALARRHWCRLGKAAVAQLVSADKTARSDESTDEVGVGEVLCCELGERGGGGEGQGQGELHARGSHRCGTAVVWRGQSGDRMNECEGGAGAGC